jgi:hypothetical protein
MAADEAAVSSCPTCGERNRPAARFCGRCGDQIAVAIPSPTPTGATAPQPAVQPAVGSSPSPAPPPADPPDRVPSAARGRLVARLLVLLLLVVFVGAIARGVLLGDGARTLALPAVGEVAAVFVEGDPVFVVHDDDGDVRVLDAVDAHLPDDPKVLVYCADAGTFEDLRHGSRYTRRGGWIGGPAPTGMAAYEIVERTDGQVVVGERGDPPAREDADLDGLVVGPSCIDRLVGFLDGQPDAAVVDDLVLHDDPGSEDDARWYPSAGLDELLEELGGVAEPDAGDGP